MKDTDFGLIKDYSFIINMCLNNVVFHFVYFDFYNG